MIRPQKGPQEAALASQADILVYGGAAGSGKTWALLLESLRHIDNPHYGAVIFRRSCPEITNEGGLWDESCTLYPLLRAKPSKTDLYWRFPSGAKVHFTHLQHEHTVYDYQGAQIPLIGFDELTHFTQKQFFYLLTRSRSTSGVRPYVRCTCNPDADSWVATFIDWWIDEVSGFPIAERSGVIRWMVRNEEDDSLAWADTPEELTAKYPAQQPVSITFIPAKLADNQILMQKDPGYLAKLMMQPLLERERLLKGNWKIRASAGKIFNRAWFEIVDAAPVGAGIECRFWDFAGTEKKLANAARGGGRGSDPDFTASVRMRYVHGIFYITDCTAGQIGPTEVDRRFKNLSFQDREVARGIRVPYRVRWEIEPGSASIRENLRLIQMLAGYDCAGVDCGRDDKITRAKPFASQCEAGNVKLVRAPWNEAWLSHMHGQPELPHDDIMDASAGAFNELVKPQAGRAAVGGSVPQGQIQPQGMPRGNMGGNSIG